MGLNSTSLLSTAIDFQLPPNSARYAVGTLDTVPDDRYALNLGGNSFCRQSETERHFLSRSLRAMGTGFRPVFEFLSPRLVLASITGTIAFDSNGDHIRDANDVPVPNGFVWADVNHNGRFEQSEPSDFSDSAGLYFLEDVSLGDVSIRMLPPVGFIQTYPYEHVAMQYDLASDNYRLAKLDSISGAVTPLGAANDTNRNGLIKTVDGEYYATGHVFDSLYQVDAVTGQQTLIGHLGQEVVGGLAYDPLMNEIYTLARSNDDGDPVSALHLFKVDRATAQLVPVSDVEPSIDGIRFTTSLAFDWVNREIVLFDNGTDTAYAYDLQGEIRQLGTFAENDAFFNLAFDGFRFLTHRIVNDVGVLYEVDPSAGTLTPLTQLESPLNVNAADRLATNQAHQLNVLAIGEEIAAVDFLTTKLVIPAAQFNVSPELVELRSPAVSLVSLASMGDSSTEMRFCVAGETNLDLQFAGTATQSMQIELGDSQDRVTVQQAVFADWPNLDIDLGTARDVLIVNAAEEFDLAVLSGRLSGVDRIELTGPAATLFRVNQNVVASISDANTLTIELGSEDTLQLVDDTWFAAGINTTGDRRMHELATDQVFLTARDGSLWRNPLNALDVNFDGTITPLDALIVINLLNRTSASRLDEAIPAFFSAEYVDPNGDNFVAPLDALMVINHLNRI